VVVREKCLDALTMTAEIVAKIAGQIPQLIESTISLVIIPFVLGIDPMLGIVKF
jgi:hypothetical protein